MVMTNQIGNDTGVQSERVSQSSNTVMLILPPELSMALWPYLLLGVFSGTPNKWSCEAINKEDRSQ